MFTGHININKKDVHGKYILNMGVNHGFEKNETATIFFLKKPNLVLKRTIPSILVVHFTS